PTPPLGGGSRPPLQHADRADPGRFRVSPQPPRRRRRRWARQSRPGRALRVSFHPRGGILMRGRRLDLLAGIAGSVLLSAAALADEAKGPSEDELAKATQNPIAALASVPFQFNFTTGGDLGDRTQLVLNFQPVLPLKVNERWNLILRTIVPI